MPFLRERSGRWSPVKVVAFVAAVLPALWIAYQAAADELGARPVTEAIHQAGDWALRFLLITLAITRAAHLALSPRHSRQAHARRCFGRLCRPAFFALRLGPAFRCFESGKRDRLAHLSDDRRARIGRPDRARVHLDGRRYQPAGFGALARPSSLRLRHRGARRGALFHTIQAQHLPAGADGGVPDLAAGVPGALPTQRRG